jgi:hypothetical protein
MVVGKEAVEQQRMRVKVKIGEIDSYVLRERVMSTVTVAGQALIDSRNNAFH